MSNTSSSATSLPQSIADRHKDELDSNKEELDRQKILAEKAERLFGYSLTETYLYARNNPWSSEHYGSLRQTPVLVNYATPPASLSSSSSPSVWSPFLIEFNRRLPLSLQSPTTSSIRFDLDFDSNECAQEKEVKTVLVEEKKKKN